MYFEDFEQVLYKISCKILSFVKKNLAKFFKHCVQQ